MGADDGPDDLYADIPQVGDAGAKHGGQKEQQQGADAPSGGNKSGEQGDKKPGGKGDKKPGGKGGKR